MTLKYNLFIEEHFKIKECDLKIMQSLKILSGQEGRKLCQPKCEP